MRTARFASSATSASGGILALSGVSAAPPLDGPPQRSTVDFVTSSWTGPSEVEQFDVVGCCGSGPPNNYVACDSSGPVGVGTYARTVRSSAAGIGANGATKILALRASATAPATAV